MICVCVCVCEFWHLVFSAYQEYSSRTVDNAFHVLSLPDGGFSASEQKRAWNV